MSDSEFARQLSARKMKIFEAWLRARHRRTEMARALQSIEWKYEARANRRAPGLH